MHGAATAPLLPAFAQAAACFLALNQECVATGAWARLVLEMREVTSALTSAVRRMCVRSAAGSPPMLRGENSKNAGGRPGWQEGKQQQQK